MIDLVVQLAVIFWVVIAAIAGFLWGVATALFQAMLILTSLAIIYATVHALVAPKSVISDRAAYGISIEMLRDAIRSGQLDAEIARAIHRNQQRRSI